MRFRSVLLNLLFGCIVICVIVLLRYKWGETYDDHHHTLPSLKATNNLSCNGSSSTAPDHLDSFVCPLTYSLPNVLPQLLKETREKFLRIIRELMAEMKEGAHGRALILVGGSKQKRDQHGGMEWKFEQRSHFRYLFGEAQDECYGFIDLASGSAVLLAPVRNDNGIAFYGQSAISISNLKEQYSLDSVVSTAELKDILMKYKTKYIYCPDANELTSKLQIQEYSVEILSWELAEQTLNLSRKQKTVSEKYLLNYAIRVSVAAHKLVHQALRELESSDLLATVRESALQHYFSHLTAACGCAEQAYVPMVASGSHASILDYEGLTEILEINGSTEIIQRPDSKLVLIDAGALCRGYAADITRTYVLLAGRNDYVTNMLQSVHDVVLEANRAGISIVKPGLLWSDLEIFVRKSLLNGLIRIGLVRKTVLRDEEFADSIASWFMPHAVTHPLGLLVHDPIEGEAIMDEMYITIEPGIYFFPHLIERVGISPTEGIHQYLNYEILKLMRSAGGVRIEDIVYVSSTSQVLTSELSSDFS